MKVTTQSVIDHLNRANKDQTDPCFEYAKRDDKKGYIICADGRRWHVTKGDVYMLISSYKDGWEKWQEMGNIRRQIESR